LEDATGDGENLGDVGGDEALAADGDVVFNELDAAEGEAVAQVAADAVLGFLVVGEGFFDFGVVGEGVEPVGPAEGPEAGDHDAAEFGFGVALGVEAGFAHVGAGAAEGDGDAFLLDVEFVEEVEEQRAVGVEQLAAQGADALEFAGGFDAVFEVLQVVVDDGGDGRGGALLAEGGDALQLAGQDGPADGQVQGFEGAAFAFVAFDGGRVVVA
jgi:hypothetical protein